jgi:hypothetical protein
LGFTACASRDARACFNLREERVPVLTVAEVPPLNQAESVGEIEEAAPGSEAENTECRSR